MNGSKRVTCAAGALFATIALSLAMPSLALAQEASAGDVKEKFAKDKTGTNPLNFTFDARLYDEYRWLNTDGDGSQNLPVSGGDSVLRAVVGAWRIQLPA